MKQNNVSIVIALKILLWKFSQKAHFNEMAGSFWWKLLSDSVSFSVDK